MSLKYLFRVEFVDGSVVKQNKEDVSATDPKRSAFFDVLESGKEIKRFALQRFLETWAVDLTTGVFEHNGSLFQLEENPSQEKKELVFFRQHQHDMVTGVGETAHRIIYFLGYRVGEVQHVVGIK